MLYMVCNVFKSYNLKKNKLMILNGLNHEQTFRKFNHVPKLNPF